jgi:hypothetical protein
MTRESRKHDPVPELAPGGMAPSRWIVSLVLVCSSCGRELAEVKRFVGLPAYADQPVRIAYRSDVRWGWSSDDRTLHLRCSRCPKHDGQVNWAKLTTALDALVAQAGDTPKPKAARLQV